MFLKRILGAKLISCHIDVRGVLFVNLHKLMLGKALHDKLISNKIVRGKFGLTNWGCKCDLMFRQTQAACQ